MQQTQFLGKRIKLQQISLTGNYESPPLPTLPNIQGLFSPRLAHQKETIQSPRKKVYAKPTQSGKTNVPLISQSSRNLDGFNITQQFSISPCKSYRTSLRCLTPHEINFRKNLDHIYIVKQPVNDISQLKIMQMSRQKVNSGYKEDDIYLKKKKLLLEAQIALGATRLHTQLALFDYQQINFFEEIPQNCKLVFLGNKTMMDFWEILFAFHNFEFLIERQNKILNIIQYVNSTDELLKFLQDKEIFQEVIESNDICSPMENLILPITARSKQQQFQKSNTSNDLQFKLDQNLKKQMHILKTEENEEIQMIRNRLDESLKDYKIEVKSDAIQDLLEKQGLNKNIKQNQKKYLKLSNFKSQCSTIAKTQSKNQTYKNQFTKFPLYIAQSQPLATYYNIPKLMEKTGLNRSEIHEIYSRYKALLSFECTQIPGMTKEMLPNGISRDSFAAGLNELSMAPAGVIDQLFNLFAIENSLDFEGFLQIINLITAKSNEKKIELILKLIDENGNGLLSYEEISQRCEMMMDSIMKCNIGEPCTNNMVDIITKSIFDAVEMNYDEEIPIEKLRLLIESRSQASKALLMMCCGDINYID
ncbi:unnamed protein product [Paramecium pentaurelia]|uniref:EF-hand domain-containing protein n=1 Tax=Paramecium pentaurelia TaxID=43138 RepID=A0A8S1STA5_9CILI|nr:unnamed protein product [Paramecium pentaurelia]